MKFLIILTAICFAPFISRSQELEENAKYIKENYNAQYEKTIKKYSLQKWGEDFNMVVYEINKQSDALTEVLDNFESKYTSTFGNAIIKWSHPNCDKTNTKLWNKLQSLNIASLLNFECDWSMVKYEYDKQVKARKSF